MLRGTTTSLQGDITDNASLVFDQTGTGSFDGDIDGTGSLTKLGTGTVILAGSSSYNGGTLVSAGTLQGTAASLRGDITDNANVTFDQASDATAGSSISGSGSVTKIGAGTLIFASSNNYSGGTTVNAGVLQLGDSGNQPSFGGAVVANGSGGFTVANADTTGVTSITANDNAAVLFLGQSSANSAVIVTNDGATTTFTGLTRGGTAHLTTNDSGSLQFQDSFIADSAAIVTNDSATTTFAGSSTAATASITTNDSAFTFFQDDSNGGACDADHQRHGNGPVPANERRRQRHHRQ